MFDSKLPKAILFLVLVVLLIAPMRYNSKELSSILLLGQIESQVKGPISNDGKPIMHTFFEEVPGGCCGASSSGHSHLLSTWKSAWEKAGWDTKVLTLEDSKKNSFFDLFEKTVLGLQIDEYNKRCFYRWFAMSGLEGGGWMSDYDVFPLSISHTDGLELPNYGHFTSYEGSVPSLLSGSEQEWNRMSSLMIKTIPVHKGLFSDMYILDTIRHSKDIQDLTTFIHPNEAVVQGFLYDREKKVDCEHLNGIKAIHLSHESTDAAFQHGKFPIDVANLQDALENRGSAAEIYLADWENQCKVN